jgi:hypothetical protein
MSNPGFICVWRWFFFLIDHFFRLCYSESRTTLKFFQIAIGFSTYAVNVLRLMLPNVTFLIFTKQGPWRNMR